MKTNKFFQIEPSDSHIDPPGTCLFDPPEVEDVGDARQLKRHPKRTHLILRPQPSDDPKDPLNWSWARKELLFFALTWISCLTGVIGPILVPAFLEVSADLNEPISKIANLNGILVMFEGVGAILVVMFSNLCGRRLMYLIFTTLQFVGCIWGAVSKSYGSLYGARILQGLGMAASAVISGSTITDAFFTYEHGLRITIWQISYVASINLAPIISGQIAEKAGWHTTFWVLAAFEAVGLILVFTFMPETYYARTPSPVDTMPGIGQVKPSGELVEDVKESGSTTDNALSSQLPHSEAKVDYSPMSLRHQLAVPYKPITQGGSVANMVRPWALVLTPNIIWALLAYTMSFNWFVGTAAIYSQVYGGQYYTKSVGTVGYIAGWPPLIGACISSLASGPIIDWGARWLSVRNHGIFEPEYRLIIMIPAAAATAIGAFGWGLTIGNGYDIIVGEVFSAFLWVGAFWGCCGTIGYANSCFPARGGDGFGIMVLLRSAYIFGSSYIYNQFMAESGAAIYFGVYGGVTVGLYLLAIPVFIYGKVWRSWCARNRFLSWVVL